MKTGFTEYEESLIQVICSLYNIQTMFYKNGVFKGIIPKNIRITLNGTYFMKLLNTDNAVYINMNEGEINTLLIIK